MKKLFALVLAVVFIASIAAFAATEKVKDTRPVITMTGTIIDNSCAASHKSDLKSFIKTHTKDCALMPSCVASGYSLYTEKGELIPFNRGSYKKIASFLKEKNSKLTVKVEVVRDNKAIMVKSIKNK
jgi:hypothetical protein